MASVDAASLTARNEAAMTTPIPRRCVIFTGPIGSVVEYYDLGVYGYAATTFAALFFPFSSPIAGLLATLVVFAIAFDCNFLTSHDRLLHSGIAIGFVPS